MLDSIKSYFFIKKVMSLLPSKIFLDLVKYNNNLKKRLYINLVNYKILSGKYKEGGQVGIWKEYNAYNNKLLFEGEYKNGKRNGKGKEYDYPHLIFECQYNNGKEYDDYRYLIFEGEYKNGKRNGKGKEYNKYKNLIFEGEYKNGKKWNGIGYGENNSIAYKLSNGKGHVKEYNYTSNKIFLIYEGEYLNGERNGKGKEFDEYGNLIFEGHYLYGKRNGEGKQYGNDDILGFEGEFKNDKPWNGKLLNADEWIKKEVKNGKIYKYDNGELKLYYAFLKEGYYKEYDEIDDELEFEGEYINGEKNGKGKEYGLNGTKIRFEGEYLYDHKIKGKEYYSDGKIEFEGEFLYDRKWNGKGYDKNGNIIYELTNGNGKVKEYRNFNLKYDGELKNGEKYGKGKEYYYNGALKFEGEYNNGKKIGKGKEFNDNGELIFDGEYLNDKRWNGKIKQYNNNNLLYEGIYVNGIQNNININNDIN